MSQDIFTEEQKSELRKSLLLAYRKAKADVFYQSTDRLKILKYEERLEHNLEELHDAIVFGRNADLFSTPDFTGTGTFAPKSLELDPNNANNPRPSIVENVVFTSPIDQWNEKTSEANSNGNPYKATFRLMADSGMGLHVLSALWLKHVGAALEKKLFFETPYANRIRRTRDKEYNTNSLGTFERYLDGYRTWISDTTEAMDRIIKQKKKVASFTTDAIEYFHRIPASILDSVDFQKEYLFRNKIDALGMRITECLSEALINWEQNTAQELKLNSKDSEHANLGLPVGLSCSAFLGNVVLDSFDKAIVEEIKPVYYGRYVDDITIVLEWHDEFTNPMKVWHWIQKRITGLIIKPANGDQDPSGDGDVSFQVLQTPPSLGQTRLDAERLSVTFKADKTKLLVADATSGKRAIDALKHALEKNSSEWKLLAHTPLDAADIGPALITAMDEAGEPAVRSSQLKTLSSMRSELSIWLREFEQLERLCEPDTWTKHRQEFYSVVQEQLLTPLKFMDFFTIIPRVLALALNCGDIKDFQKLVKNIADAISSIEKNAQPKISPQGLISNSNIYEFWRAHIFNRVQELIMASSPSSVSVDEKEKSLEESSKQLLGESPDLVSTYTYDHSPEDSWFYRLFNHDLALVPFKEILSPVEVSAVKFSNWDIENGKVGGKSTEEPASAAQISVLLDAFPEILGAFKRSFWRNILSHSRLLDGAHVKTVENRHLFNAIIFPTRPLSVQQAISWSGYLIPHEASQDENHQHSISAFGELDKWLSFLRGFSIQNAVSATNDIANPSLTLCSAGDPSTPSTIFGVSSIDDGQHRHVEVRIPSENSVLDREPRIAVASLFTSSNQITRSIAGKTELDYECYRAFTKFIDQVVSPVPEASQPDYVLFQS